MTPDQFPTLITNIEGRTKDNFVKWLEFVSDAAELGEILNPRYNDAKYFINHAIEDAYAAIVKKAYLTVHHAGEIPDSQKEAMNDLYWIPSVQLSNYKSVTKKLSALSKLPLAKLGLEYMKEITPLCELMADLKTKVVKKITKTAEERKQEKYTPPASSAKAVEQVKAILEDICNRQYQQLLDSIHGNYMSMLTRYLAKQQAILDGSDERSARYKNRQSYSTYEFFTDKQGRCDARNADLIGKAVWNGPDGNYFDPYQARPEASEILLAEATKIADDIRLTYVAKNLRKLTSILEAKGDDLFESVKEVAETIHLASLEGTMLFKFKDGSRFTVNNSVVWVMNSFGTQFYRFPLTFHNVVMPDGTPMKAPSEKRMNTVFVGKA